MARNAEFKESVGLHNAGVNQNAGIGIDGENYRYNIGDLISHTENTPTTKLGVKKLHKRTAKSLEGSGEVEDDRKQRIAKADLAHPIIVTQHPKQGFTLLDGTHRLEKAHNLGLRTINAKVIPWEEMGRYKRNGG